MKLGAALLLLVMLATAGPGSFLAGNAEPAEPLASFVGVAAAARAASIVIRAPSEEGLAIPVPVSAVAGEGPLAVLSARRRRILGVGVIVDPQRLAVTSARVVRLVPGFKVTRGP